MRVLLDLLLILCLSGGCSESDRTLPEHLRGVWTVVGTMASAREGHAAVPISGDRVLLTGGLDRANAVLDSVEIYDVTAGSVVAAAPMGSGRWGHSATVLADGRVLVAGGMGTGGALSSAEIFDPASGSWSPALPMASPRYQHGAVSLAGGAQVLVVGGLAGAMGQVVAGCELYDVARRSWGPAGALGAGRGQHTTTSLPGGRVLVAGGTDGLSALRTTEIYDVQLPVWVAGPGLSSGRLGHAAALVDGRVLLVGGQTTTVDLLDPERGSVRALLPLDAERGDHTLTPLPQGPLLLAGGQGGGHSHDTTLLFDAENERWVADASMNAARYGHRATLLADGRVVVSGGRDQISRLASIELRSFAGGAVSPDGGPADGEAGLPTTEGGVVPDGSAVVPEGGAVDAGGE
jgi:hypothetical protein